MTFVNFETEITQFSQIVRFTNVCSLFVALLHKSTFNDIQSYLTRYYISLCGNSGDKKKTAKY